MVIDLLKHTIVNVCKSVTYGMNKPDVKFFRTYLESVLEYRTTILSNLGKSGKMGSKYVLVKLFGIARSSLHHTPVRKKKDDISHKELEIVHTEHPWYGHRRIAWTLGWSLGKTRRLMKVFSISALVKKSRRWTKSEDVGIPDTGILNLAKDIPASRPNRVWRTDFTYLVWKGMPFYLATVLDAYSREIVGYAISLRHTKEFVLEAMKDAIRKTKCDQSP